MEGQVLCGYCGVEIDDLDDHLPECEKQPFWIKRRFAAIPKIGLEREGWDTPPEAA